MTKDAQSPYVAELRNELVAAAHRKIAARKRRQRYLLNGAALLLVLVLAVGYMQFSSKPSSAAVLSVTRSNHVIMVDLKSTSATPKEIADELDHYGIDAKVTEKPVSPSGVGRLVSFSLEGTASIAQPSSAYFMHFSLSDEKGQHVELGLGRAAKPGESYVKLVNAYDHGEVLNCSNTLGRQVRDVIDKVNSLNVDVHWYTQRGPEIYEVDVPPFSTYFITGATSDKPNSIIVYISETPNPFTVSGTDCS